MRIRSHRDGTVALSILAFAEDGKTLVYGTSGSGSDWQEFRVRDVATKQDRTDHLKWIKFSSAAWTQDGAGFFYSRYPEPAAGTTRCSKSITTRRSTTTN